MEITINWMQILQAFGVLGGIATMFGFFLAPMLYLGAKIDSLKDQLHSEVKSLQAEMHKESKDFHARLALQDQEFKIRMCALEENYLKNKRN